MNIPWIIYWREAKKGTVMTNKLRDSCSNPSKKRHEIN